jgi:hypothetical protein
MSMENVRKEFYEEYLEDYIDEFSDQKWNMIKEHIATHKYLLNEDYKNEISLTEAYTSWIEYVWEPFIFAVEYTKLLEYSDFDILNLYETISFDWKNLKDETPKELKQIGIDDATKHYCIQLKEYPWWRKTLLKIKGA